MPHAQLCHQIVRARKLAAIIQNHLQAGSETVWNATPEQWEQMGFLAKLEPNKDGEYLPSDTTIGLTLAILKDREESAIDRAAEMQKQGKTKEKRAKKIKG